VGTWWWAALGVIVAAALVAALVDGGARLGPRRRIRTPPPDAGPRPGELWWTHPPSLVLVLEVRRESARVADVDATEAHAPGAAGTEEPAAQARDRDGERLRPEPEAPLPLPPGTITAAPERSALLHPRAVREVPPGALRHRAGAVAPDTWERVRRATGHPDC